MSDVNAPRQGGEPPQSMKLLAAAVTEDVTERESAARRAAFVRERDPIRTNARHDVAHRFEAGQRRSIDLEGEQRGGREPTPETRAGACEATQSLILQAPDR